MTASVYHEPVPSTPVASMTRAAMEAEIMWNGGGMGYGIARMAGIMMAAMDQPGPNKPDWPSVVAVSGPASKYSDDELRALVEFSRRQTRDYDRRWKWRRGANLVCIDKGEPNADGSTSWFRKRQSWDTGMMWSATLEHAMAIFDRDVGESLPVDVVLREANELARRGHGRYILAEQVGDVPAEVVRMWHGAWGK